MIKSLRLCVSESVTRSVCHTNQLNALHTQFSTDFHQTCQQGRVPGDVVTYCFWWKSVICMSVKPELELILTLAPMENIWKTVEIGCWTQRKTNYWLSICTMNFDPG